MHKSVAERHLVAVDRRDVFEDRRALTGERGLLDLQRGGQEQPPVGGDAVARFDQHDIAGDELGGVDLDDRPVSAHAGDVLQHLLQGGEAGFGLRLLSQAQHGVEDGEADQHDRRAGLTGHDLVDDRRDDQDDLHQVLVLAHEGAQRRLLLLAGEHVRAVLGLTLAHLARGEPAGGVDTELGDGVVDPDPVPGAATGCSFGGGDHRVLM